MLTKSKLRQQLDALPEEFSIDELIERLILIEKIEKANQQSLEGKTISEADLENEIQKWFE